MSTITAPDQELEAAEHYLAGGNHHAVLVAASRAAIGRRGWPAPFRLIAKACAGLGDELAAKAYLRLAEQMEGKGTADPETGFSVPTLLTDEDYSANFSQIAGSGRETNGSSARVKLIAGGDVCLGRQMPGYVGLHGPAWPFQRLASRLRNADCAMVNLETSVTTLGDFLDKNGRRPYYYHNRPEMLDVLAEAGIQVVCTANNHAMDYGPDGLRQQSNILDVCGFAPFGAGTDEQAAAMPAYVQVGGLTLAFVGVETETACMSAGASKPGIQHANGRDILPVVAASIAQARAHADVIIVSPHWGKNWREAPPQEFRRLARAFIDLGADAVLGHSAHILQGVELYTGRPIIYDMGTLLFDRVEQNRMRHSALFELTLTSGGVESLEIIPVRLDSGRAVLADGLDAGHIRKLMTELSKELDHRISFTLRNESLVLACAPPPKPDYYRQPPPVERMRVAGALPKVPEELRELKSNVVYPEAPADCAWPSPVKVNADLEVLGARFAPQVRPGRGFLCEVFFCSARPPVGRWEARLTGISDSGETSFTYTHPVADGIWPAECWRRDEVIGDRVVVRPPGQLPEGIYRLYWHLIDLESGTSMIIDEHTDPRLIDGKIYLGKIKVSERAPAGVAGVAFPLPPELGHLPDAKTAGIMLNLGEAEAMREGWQCRVYVFKNHVIKVLKSAEESWDTIAREYKGDTAEAFKIVREAVQPSIDLIARNKPPVPLLGNFEVLAEGVFRQARGENLGEALAQLLRQGKLAEIGALLTATLDLVIELWRYGLSETSWKFNKNYGVLNNGDVTLLDCLELTGDREFVQRHIEQSRWLEKNQRFIGDLPILLCDEFKVMLKARLTSQVLALEWGTKLGKIPAPPEQTNKHDEIGNIMQSTLMLDYQTIARVTGGDWRNYQAQPELSGISTNTKYIKEGSSGNFFFALSDPTTPDVFGDAHRAAVLNAFKVGAVAVAVPRSAKGLPEDRPLLLVDNVREALKQLGLYVRNQLFVGKRVLVTGTEGKTGFKCMLGHVLSKQMPVHYVGNSSNLDVAIYASMASIKHGDRVAILEASVANPGRGVQRSQIVQPHVAVITEVGNEHLKYHGTQQALIEAKAGIVDAVMDGGYCILNADSANYLPVRKAVLARRRLPILVFGSQPWCNGYLRSKEFGTNGWRVQALIEGEEVEYQVPLVGEHVPLATVSVLLAAYHLGADVAQAAASFVDFVPYESQGVLRKLVWKDAEFLCYDNASRASVLSYQSALRVVPRLHPLAEGGRKIGVIGEMIYLGDASEEEHRRLAEWVTAAGFDALILVGANTRITFEHLDDKSKVIRQFYDYNRITSGNKQFDHMVKEILAEVQPGDLLFVKGELDEFGDYLRALEIKPPTTKPQPELPTVSSPHRKSADRTDPSALQGLLPISRHDLPRYKKAINQTRQTCWQSYYPFLYFQGQNSNSTFLIDEDAGSVCIYRLRRQANVTDLSLFLLPMPFQQAVLERCLERVRDYNGDPKASIFRIDAEDVELFKDRPNTRIVACPEEYIYAPASYRDLSGGKNRNLRRYVNKFESLDDVEVADYRLEDQAGCMVVMDRWVAFQKAKYGEVLFHGYTSNCLMQFERFPRQDLFGKVIRIGGEIRSFGFAGEMRTGLGNLFITYCDYQINGLNEYLNYCLLREMDSLELVNASNAGNTPGLIYAKQKLGPVALHPLFQVYAGR
jgi:UDP-N-acetylmuramyl pentapeptide synthase/poly-gamma-glutamate capsule biosynthesis protein CapA/YwtB (metallophosphatase superfamily)